MLPDFDLSVQGKYAPYLGELGISRFYQLLDFIAKLPYGRTTSRTDFESLFREKKGTCSLKHGVLAELAGMNGQTEIHLMVGLFLMDEVYAPVIAPVLSKSDLPHIPEAHCYLRYNDLRYDFTTEKATNLVFERTLVREQRCEPGQLAEWKPMIHKHYIESWLKRKNLTFSPEEIWQIREECIKLLEK